MNDHRIGRLDIRSDDFRRGLGCTDKGCVHKDVKRQMRTRNGQSRGALANVRHKKFLSDDVRQQDIFESVLVLRLQQRLDNVGRNLGKGRIRRSQDGCILESLDCVDKSGRLEEFHQGRQLGTFQCNLKGALHLFELKQKSLIQTFLQN